PDCEPSNVFLYESRVENATDPAARTITTVNAAVRPIHQNSVCQGGTLCVANGKDRRLGDFFTNALDSRGCVMIASGDTTQVDPNTGGPMATSLPVILRQNSGSPLTGSGTCGITVNVPPGNYRAVVRAVDSFGNKETPSARRDIIRFRLPRR